MTALAWPFVALAVSSIVVWRMDAFAKRWANHSQLTLDVAELKRQMAQTARLDDFTVVRDKLNHLITRLPPQK